MSREGAGDRAGGHASGVATTRAVVLLAVAVILGVVLLQSLDNRPATVTAGTARPETTTTRVRRTQTPVPAVTTSTQAPRPPGEVKVFPINGTSTSGVGLRVSRFLGVGGKGYNVLAAENSPKPVEASSVLYAPGREADARAVAAALGLSPAAVQPIPAPPPLPDLRDADVIVIAGPDLAARADLAGRPTTTNTTAGSTATTRRTTATTGRSSVRPIPSTPTTVR